MAVENGRKNHEHIIPQFEYTMRDVVEKDFLPTLMLIRETYDPYFKPNHFNELLNSLEWLREGNHLARFEKSELTENHNGMPKFLMDYRFSIKLFFELEHNLKNGKYAKIEDVLVAYSHKNKERLERDLDENTYASWLKFKDDPLYANIDALCVKVFRSYWTVLELRASFGALKNSREPSGKE